MTIWINWIRIVFSQRCSKLWKWNDRCWSVRQWVVVMYCHTWCCQTLVHAVSERLHLFHWLQWIHKGSPMHSIIVVRYGNLRLHLLLYLHSTYLPTHYLNTSYALQIICECFSDVTALLVNSVIFVGQIELKAANVKGFSWKKFRETVW